MQDSLEAFRLSPQQRQRWERRACAAEATAQGTIELRTKAAARAETAIAWLIARHEVLRTALVVTPGMRQPLQTVRAVRGAAVRRVDLEALGGAAALRILCAEERRPFDLAAELPCRFVVARLDTQRSFLVLTLDALVADRRSVYLMATALGAAIEGHPPENEPVQYLEYAAWLEAEREAQGSEGRYFWQAATAKAEPLALPSARDRGRPEGAARGRLACRLPPPLVAGVESLAADLDVSWADVLLGAWAAFLSRLIGQARIDLLYGADGRAFEELEDAFGLFADDLPITIRVEADMRFDEVVRRAASAAERARQHQPFHDPHHDPWLADPLERQAIGFEAVDAATPAAADVDWSLFAVAAPAERFRLKLSVERSASRLETVLSFDRRWLDGRSVGWLAAQLRALLGQAIGQPAIHIGALSLLGPAERHWLIHGLSDVPAPLADGTIVEAFERSVTAAPDAPALIGAHCSLRYRELATRVHQLARHLRAHGVGAEVRVALALERSTEVVITMLAVLEAGGAFVPLDLGLPARRLANLIAASGAAVVLTAGNLEAVRPLAGAAQVIDLVADGEAIAAHSTAPLGEAIDGRTLAYVLFTSGTTGHPKAVAVEHRQLMAYWRGLRQLLQPAGEGLTWAHVSTFAADLGHTGLLGALLTGGSLVVVDEPALADPRRLAAVMTQHAVEALKIVPSHLEALIADGEAEALLPRRLLVLGGEKPGPALLARLAEAKPSCRVLNHYGPTETTVGVLAGPFDPAAGADAVALGRPLAGNRVLVLDKSGEPAPTGTLGELHLGGDSVARGYLGQPATTAERFVPDPHGRPGARMYRSGDRALMAASGMPRFAGRVDHQLKIRGFRVEPAEIEATLTAHPEVRSAVVVLWHEGDRSQLVAYVVATKHAVPAPGALRAHLAERLPAPMVPAAIVLLETLPLGPNGKVDRRALPPPSAEPVKAWQAPRGFGETLLADLFSEVLGRPVGTADDFFELGGHSLLATQLISRVRQAFECELELRDFFDHPTVAGLARAVAQRRRGDGVLPPIEAVARDRDLPLSFAQERLWIMHQLQPASAAYNIPRVVRLTGPLDAGRLMRAVAAVVERHESLRTVFPSVEGVGVQRVVAGGRAEARVVDLCALPSVVREPEAMRLAAREIRRPFDLARGPVMRTLLLREDAESHLAVLTLHHITSDAWSMSVLIDEMVTAYRAGGRLHGLPPLAVHYADFAVWQREQVGAELEAQLAFWRRHLASAPSQTLPTDHPRPELPTYRGANFSVAVEPELRGRIEALGRTAGVTLFMTLLAGFKALLARHTGCTDIVVGTDVAGRDRLETERLIGFFVNNLVLRTGLDGDPTFRELLARVRTSTLAAYSHQDLPFDRLVRALNPGREVGRTPLFQVLFVLQNTPRAELELDGLRVAPVEIGLGSAKFDLGLFVTQRGDGLTLTWSYRSDLFEASTVRVLARQQIALLASACDDPDQRIGALEMSSGVRSVDDKRARLRRRPRLDAAAAGGGGTRV